MEVTLHRNHETGGGAMEFACGSKRARSLPVTSFQMIKQVSRVVATSFASGTSVVTILAAALQAIPRLRERQGSGMKTRRR